MSEPFPQHGTAEAVRYEALRAIAGSVAHDLNNILTGIAGNLQLLQEAGAAKHDLLSEFLDGALQSVARGAQLSQKMEAIAGRLLLHPGPVNINRLVKRALQTLAPVLPNALEVKSTLSPEDPVAMVDGKMALSAMNALSESALHVAGNEPCTLEFMTGASSSAGPFVTISAIFSGVARFAEAIALAFTAPYSSSACFNANGWNLAGVTGFVRQSHGHLTLHRDSAHITRLDMLLPQWTPRQD